MIMRIIGSAGLMAAVVTVSVSFGTSVSGQTQPEIKYSTPPPLVITAFGGKPVDYKAPRTPWGDPDLQGVWSSDDMENVGIAAGGGGRGRGGPGAAGRGAAGAAPQAAPAAPAGPPPLYLTDEQMAARRKQ